MKFTLIYRICEAQILITPLLHCLRRLDTIFQTYCIVKLQSVHCDRQLTTMQRDKILYVQDIHNQHQCFYLSGRNFMLDFWLTNISL